MALKSWTTDGYTSSGGWSWRQIVEDVSYDIVNNTSVVTVYAQIKGTYFGGTPTITINCNGEVKSISPTYSYPTYIRDWTTMFSHSFTIWHNSDGSKDISVSTSWSFAYIPNTANASGNYSLTTIPRATPAPTLTLNVKDTSIFYIQPYANFSHAAKITVGSYSAYLTQGSSRNPNRVVYSPSVKSFELDCDSSFYKLFTGTQIVGTLTIETYSGSTLIGTDSSDLTIKANEILCKPVAVGSMVDTNSATLELTKSEDNIVKYKSIPKTTLRIDISDDDDSNTKLTYLNVAGNTISNLNQREFTIQNPQNNYTVVSLKNSRTFSNTSYVYASGTFINYILPTVTIISLKRTEPTTGDITVSYKGDYFNDKFSANEPNTLTVAWYYKEKGATDWILGGNLTPNIPNNKNTFSQEVTIKSIFNYQKQYEFKIAVDDRLASNSATYSVPRGYPIFWWGDNFVDVLGDLRVQGKSIVVPNISYCKMNTNFETKTITTETQITKWGAYQENGDLFAYPSRNRLEITNTRLAIIMGKTCGQYGMSAYLELRDSDGNLVLGNNQQSHTLVQPSGNNFWSEPLPTTLVVLDPAKTYYVTLWAGSYDSGNVGTAYMNNGFGENGTWMAAIKLM